MDQLLIISLFKLKLLNSKEQKYELGSLARGMIYSFIFPHKP